MEFKTEATVEAAKALIEAQIQMLLVGNMEDMASSNAVVKKFVEEFDPTRLCKAD